MKREMENCRKEFDSKKERLEKREGGGTRGRDDWKGGIAWK